MRGSKPTDALRTLPERAFRLRARLIAVGLCAVCFAGLIGRLFWLQLCTGGWYTQRALGQQLRDTVVPADRGKIYSADGALLAANSSCWTLRASPREMPEDKLALAAKGLAEILELNEAKLLEKFWTPPPCCPVRSWSRASIRLWTRWLPLPVFWKRTSWARSTTA